MLPATQWIRRREWPWSRRATNRAPTPECWSHPPGLPWWRLAPSHCPHPRFTIGTQHYISLQACFKLHAYTDNRNTHAWLHVQNLMSRMCTRCRLGESSAASLIRCSATMGSGWYVWSFIISLAMGTRLSKACTCNLVVCFLIARWHVSSRMCFWRVYCTPPCKFFSQFIVKCSLSDWKPNFN